MELYLIRHTQVNIAPGICYGRSNIDVHEHFDEDVARLKSKLERLNFNKKPVFSSPLIRCAKLAKALFPKQEIHYMKTLQEMDFGEWEMCKWVDIGKSAMDAWSQNLLDYPVPNGESTRIFYRRCCTAWEDILPRVSNDDTLLIITHAGVIKLLLAYILELELKDALKLSIELSSINRLCLQSGHYELNL